jgi:hypothetical protein
MLLQLFNFYQLHLRKRFKFLLRKAGLRKSEVVVAVVVATLPLQPVATIKLFKTTPKQKNNQTSQPQY